MFSQPDRHVVVLLKDGRQLDGLLVRYTDHMVVGGVPFYEHEIDEMFADE